MFTEKMWPIRGMIAKRAIVPLTLSLPNLGELIRMGDKATITTTEAIQLSVNMLTQDILSRVNMTDITKGTTMATETATEMIMKRSPNGSPTVPKA